jgi:LMBR1 domain-containing protein 1
LDVANKTNAVGCKEGWNTACGNIDMDILWIIVFMSVIIFIVVLIPYSIYYYEAEDVDEEGPSNRRWIEALKLESATVIAAAIIMAVLFITVSKTNIPLRQIEVLSTDESTGFHNFTDGMTLNEIEMEYASSNLIEPIKMTLEVSFPIYITGLVSFVGWFGFTIFTGIGLVALPMDLILAFLYRPQYISADVYAHQKLILQKKSLELIELGKSIKAGMDKTAMQKLSAWEKRKQKRLDFVSVNKFKQAVYLLENDAEDLKLCHEEYKNFNPLVAVGKFILGIFCAIISLVWVFHIGLYMVPPIPLVPFLNTYFILFDRFFPLFGTISVGIFSTYLLAAAVKGCFKFGMRCFCFSVS